MEGEQTGAGTAEAGGGGGGGADAVLRKPMPSRPQPTMPSRSGAEAGAAHKPIESPMSSMVSGFLADQETELEDRSFSHLLAGAIDSPSSDAAEEEEKEKPLTAEAGGTGNNGTVSRSLSGGSGSGSPGASGGSFAERLAARGAANKAAGVAAAEGAGPPRPPNSGRFKAMPPSRIPIPQQGSYLTIPAGLSPTTLFDSSPVLLSTSQVFLSVFQQILNFWKRDGL